MSDLSDRLDLADQVPVDPDDCRTLWSRQRGPASSFYPSFAEDVPEHDKGDNIEGLGWHHSGNGLVKGLCAVTAVLRQTFAWDGVSYVSRKIISAGFRSKVDIANDIITAAREKLGSLVTVLMDSWYSCAQKHWTLVIIAYNCVAFMSSSRNRSFRRKIENIRGSNPAKSMERLNSVT